MLAVCAAVLALSLGGHFAHKDRGAQRGVRIATVENQKPQSDPTEDRGPALEVASVLHHGRIVEIEGSTDPGATVMINGEPAATFFEGHGFKHFVGPLPVGLNIVTITAQDDHGGVTTRQLAILTD